MGSRDGRERRQSHETGKEGRHRRRLVMTESLRGFVHRRSFAPRSAIHRLSSPRFREIAPQFHFRPDFSIVRNLKKLFVRRLDSSLSAYLKAVHFVIPPLLHPVAKSFTSVEFLIFAK